MAKGDPGVDHGKQGGTLPTDAGLVPFDRHPASLADLDELAGRFVRLADRGIDQDAVTGQRMTQAEANWDGLASAQLRSAPQPVRTQAQEVVGALAWASGPLWYWREQIRSFNSAVDNIDSARAQAAATRWGLAVEATDTELVAARDEFERQQRERWWQAYHTHIEEGSRTTAAMLREGPTESHLSQLRRSQVWAGQTGAVAAFLPTWHASAMEALADELGELVVRINDPDYRPTEQELTQLAEVLEQYGDDEVFAYHFLTAIGPEGLLQLTGGVALLQLNREPDLDSDLAELVGRIQTGLGVALATATTRTGTLPEGPGDRYMPSEHELPSEWLAELMVLGRKQMEVQMPYPERGTSLALNPYGYQLLGVLLRCEAEFDTGFLRLIGGDMYDLERNSGWSEVGGEGVPIWYDAAQSDGFLPLKLNWIISRDGDNGYDPIIGLLEALNHNPEAARVFFTDEVLFDDESHTGSQLPRVDYLLTDRVWPGERVGLDEQGGSQAGLDLLGEVLVKATTVEPDERSHRIVESIIYELANDEQASGYPNDPTGKGRELGVKADTFSKFDLVPPALRDSLAHIMSYYIDDMFFNLLNTTPHESVPEEYEVRASAKDVTMVLGDLGKDPHARDVIAFAATVYANVAYDYYLSPVDSVLSYQEQLDQAHTVVTQAASYVFGALDFGQINSTLNYQREEDARFNVILTDKRLMKELLGYSIPTGPVPVGTLVEEALHRAEEAAQADRTGDVNRRVGDIRHEGREQLQEFMSDAVYRNLTPEQIEALPEELLRDGEPIPIDEWDDEQERIWGGEITRAGSDYYRVLQASPKYDDGYDRAHEDLEKYTS